LWRRPGLSWAVEPREEEEEEEEEEQFIHSNSTDIHMM
jgi:hypothetical protein